MYYDPINVGERRDEPGSSMCEIPDNGSNGAETGIERNTEENDDGGEEPHGYASKKEIVNALEEAFKADKELHTKLLNFTNKRIWYYFFSGTFKGRDANDVLQIVIEKIIKGRRRWHKDRIPNIVEFILMVIVSYIRNEWKKKEISEECVGDFDDIEQLREAKLVELIRENAKRDAEDELFSKKYDELEKGCFAAFEDDETAYFVLEYMLDGVESNQEIAAGLKISVNEVSNAKRRIKYRLFDILRKINNK
jgi:RNA polymerase sigma factor (sigma-70 family)